MNTATRAPGDLPTFAIVDGFPRVVAGVEAHPDAVGVWRVTPFHCDAPFDVAGDPTPGRVEWDTVVYPAVIKADIPERRVRRVLVEWGDPTNSFRMTGPWEEIGDEAWPTD